MKKLLASLSTFAVLTGALAVPTFAATENTAKETNSQVLKVQPNVDVTGGGKTALYSSPATSYTVSGDGLAVSKVGSTWYLYASKSATRGYLYEYYNGNLERIHDVYVN
ncbi:hypothetical protein AYJ08_00870 [Brevibacillus sp. SKDU10]|uniref:hypothetical protein n=1 Tax=Brevibacillus sp. SKDU10 TaxID=1247872 RepID=UPI0007C94D0C|nr:hypothetical protein [Brevibacillus sp. SKDU10]OAJ73355.1 hypothetical protein AYJ08_00870 [Brevibacillus sp. SKDU10]